MTESTNNPPPNLEHSLNYAFELLQCAAVTIYEGGDRLSGTDRQLVFSGMHLVEKARDVIEQSMTTLDKPA